MTTKTSLPSEDDNETLYWLQVARRVLSGDIAPHDARAALGERATVTPLKRAARTRH